MKIIVDSVVASRKAHASFSVRSSFLIEFYSPNGGHAGDVTWKGSHK